ncbi:sensor domain-containing diguanylate cyclase [Lacticaseibacillus parakribbianus]|uniref:GGDEF domain-containing protein n=1 Tax=Lacticaseibacillus parakribbianus TaxID=2970927 RepID=UPI0021CB6D29|nr:GGDEF domain-containing protein [Lacticaseibacillus parakribbianus]
MAGLTIYIGDIFLAVVSTLGFMTVYTQIDAGTKRRLAQKRSLSRLAGSLPKLAYIGAILILLRGLEIGAPAEPYWLFVNLQLIILVYSNFLVQSVPAALGLQTLGLVLFVSTGGINWVTGPLYLAACLLVYSERFWGKRAAQHQLLYLVVPILIGAVFWLAVATEFPTVTRAGGIAHFLGYGWAYLALWDYEHYQRKDQQVLAQLTRDVQYDALTQVRNWAMFQRDFSTQYAALDAEHPNLALVALDVDHFKWINDDHGHLVGNQVLMTVASQLEAKLQQRDAAFQLYRTGGEEFAMILPGLTLSEAQTLVADCQKLLRGLVIRHATGELRITASFGLAMATPQDGSPTAVFKRADRYLYQSKTAGRDRVTVEGQAA